MHQNLWKPAPLKGRGGLRALGRLRWPKFFWYPVVTLGILMMVLSLRMGVSHALAGHSWQKVSSAYGVAVYSAAPAPKWDKPITTLTSDSDDDDDDDGGDCPTTAT